MKKLIVLMLIFICSLSVIACRSNIIASSSTKQSSFSKEVSTSTSDSSLSLFSSENTSASQESSSSQISSLISSSQHISSSSDLISSDFSSNQEQSSSGLNSSKSDVIISSSSLSQTTSSSSASSSTSSSSSQQLSSDTNVVINKVCGESVVNNSVVLTEEKWVELANSSSVKSLLTDTVPKGATYTAIFNKQTSKIVLDITAQDGTKKSKEISVSVQDLFGLYGSNLGQKDGFVWSNASSGYVANYLDATSIASGLYLKDSILSNYY